MELWDIYDFRRNKTGNYIQKGENLNENEYHLIAHVCLFNKAGEMLIQKRKENKEDWPGKWDISAGGAAKAGEESFQAAERELFEELGIKMSLELRRPVITVYFDDGFDDYYILELDDCILSTIHYQKEEIDTIEWASRERIVELINQGTFDIILPFIDTIFFMKENRGNHYSSAQ